MRGKLGHGRGFVAQHIGALDRRHRTQGESCRYTRSDPEDCIDRTDRAKLLDLLVAVLRELIEDHRANDIRIDMDLVRVHHGAGVSLPIPRRMTGQASMACPYAT
ncbi:hypothetical protein [Mesorhizobium sp.]|uniref:hypothetical protein n=1 Tax=Mesorhizobium sp. TaxID=1871066 RepID=UPI0025E47606|nr:hypothetical protein [Mesorhizobium sp.]